MSAVPFRVSLFSRGHGRGHAVPDAAIAERLTQRVHASLDLQFISYATGAEMLRQLGHEVWDLELPEDNPFLETIIRSAHAISCLNPDLVILHEEFAAAVPSYMLGKRTLFMTNWFLDPTSLIMNALRYVDEVLFIDDPGHFTEPPYLRGRVSYTGPIIRQMNWSRSQRLDARQTLGIGAQAFVICCMPGSSSDGESPIFDLVLGALDRLKSQFDSSHLLWLGGPDSNLLRERGGGRQDLLICDFDLEPEKFLVASDVIITKGTRNTIRECTFLGVPSISISHGLNWIDDVFANRIQSNRSLDATRLNSDELATAIRCAASEMISPDSRNGTDNVVDRICYHIEAMRNGLSTQDYLRRENCASGPG